MLSIDFLKTWWLDFHILDYECIFTFNFDSRVQTVPKIENARLGWRLREQAKLEKFPPGHKPHAKILQATRASRHAIPRIPLFSRPFAAGAGITLLVINPLVIVSLYSSAITRLLTALSSFTDLTEKHVHHRTIRYRYPSRVYIYC